MAYTLTIALGLPDVSLTPTLRLYDTSAVQSGADITTGINERGGGWYVWTYAAFPDGFRGWVEAWNLAVTPNELMLVHAINPEEAENTDVKTSLNTAILTTLQGLLGMNQGIRNMVYDGSGNLTSFDVCLYDTSAHATTNDGATGLLHKYSVASSYTTNVQTAQSTIQVS